MALVPAGTSGSAPRDPYDEPARVSPARTLHELAAFARQARRSPAATQVRRHLPLASACLGVVALARRRGGPAVVLAGISTAGFVRTYRITRRTGKTGLADHLVKLRRLRPEVLARFYVQCIASMEAELELYPLYDQRKHELRYRRVTREVLRAAVAGDTVVDVGCASGLVLDRVHARVPIRRVGFDLAGYGLRERMARPCPPLLAQAVVEDIPLREGIADVVVFSEVIEHLVDAYAGLRDVSRICRPGATLVLTTNNSSEMPEISPLRDPLTWVERLVGRRRPSVLAFRNVMWPVPIDRIVDPLPESAPTFAPHVHFAEVELERLAADAGFDLVRAGSFEFPAPQSPFADRLRRLTARSPRAGNLLSDGVERVIGAVPEINRMGTHHLLVFKRNRPPRPFPEPPWWVATVPDAAR